MEYRASSGGFVISEIFCVHQTKPEVTTFSILFHQKYFDLSFKLWMASGWMSQFPELYSIGTRWPDKLQMCPNILPARPIEKSGVEVILIKCLTGSMLRIRPIYVPPPFTLGVVMLILQTSQMSGKMILNIFSHILCSKDPGSLFWPQLKSRISSFLLAGWP